MKKVCKKCPKSGSPPAGMVYGLIEILSCLFGILPDFNDFIYEEDLHVSTIHFLVRYLKDFVHAQTDTRTFNLTAPDERKERFAQ